MSQNITINGTIQNINSVNTIEVNGSVAVARCADMRDKLRLDHGKPLCQASGPHAAAVRAYQAPVAVEGWRGSSAEAQRSPRSLFSGMEAPAAAWASLVLSTRSTSV